MNVISYPDAATLFVTLAKIIKDELAQALSHQNRATLAVPGGTTPGPIFDALCQMDIAWDRVNVVLTDERWVDETSPRSNGALIKNRLLQHKAAAATYCPLFENAPTPEDKIDALCANVDKICPLSVVLLGMGEDMHTASLFPGADQLELALSERAPTLLAMRAPGADEPRITLSAPVLNGAGTKHIVILGEKKYAALDQAKSLGNSRLAPVFSVLENAQVHYTA